MSSTEIRSLPLLPLPHGVVLPDMVVTVAAESAAAREAMSGRTVGDELVSVPERDGRFGSVGVVVRIEQRGQLANGADGAVLRALRRVRIGRGEVAESGALHVAIEEVVEPPASDAARALAREYRVVAEELLAAIGSRGASALLEGIEEPGELADTIGWWPELDDERRLQLLETVDPEARILLAVGWAREALAEARVTADIRDEVNEDLERTQRETILRRQMKAIQDELGEGGDGADELATYRARIADGTLPTAVAEAATKEVDRLERMGDQNVEAGWIRTWLDTVLEIPWSTATEDALDLEAAAQQLDEDHAGLEDVKERIVEFLAVRKLRHERSSTAQDEEAQEEERGGRRGSGTILALVGPPGVGKTSLGESVARALGRRFVRMSLGGVRDEAEIRGHRRTYVGARPGRIVRALVDAGTRNPVILLDEIDKVGADWRGDPSAALLEVLDPAQNATFRDHYVEHEIDLSDVVFIATANTLETIPAPLLDRMELIPLEGYSEDEKVAIATRHLLPSLLRRNAVTAEEVRIPDEVIRTVVADHTREAGVRRLEQRLDRLVRRAASRLAREPETTVVDIGLDDLRPALGPTPHREDPAVRTQVPGVATGLAVTGAGGDVLFVEAALLPGEDGLTLTGQLGDVMKESGQIALSYLRANRERLGIEADLDRTVHVHFPAGAIPKDGPSAGVTMTTALVSALTGRRVRPDVAMTGEVTLHGKVLPIGGVKEKVLAAQRAGVTDVILPVANGADVDELPDAVRDAVTIHLVDSIPEVLEIALTA